MKRYIRILAFGVAVQLNVAAQYNSDYIQYMFNGLLLNPAYAGSHEALDATVLCRQQWTGIEGAPFNVSFGAHSALRKKSLNAGVLLQNERIGLFNRTQAAGIYAYRFRFLDGQLALGAQFGVESSSYNWNGLQIKEAGDPNFTSVAQRNVVPLAGAGLYFHNKYLYAGFSAPSLLGEAPAMVFTGGALLPLSSSLKLKPVFILKQLSSATPVLNLSATCYFRELLGLGIGITPRNAASVFFDLAVNEQLRVGYGYARALSPIHTYAMGTHEIMLRYLFRYRIKAASPRYF